MACIWLNTRIHLTTAYVVDRLNSNELDGHCKSGVDNAIAGQIGEQTPAPVTAVRYVHIGQ